MRNVRGAAVGAGKFFAPPQKFPGGGRIISGSKITSSALHADGVFSYGSGITVNISDSIITTSGNNSGGLTTGGAVLNSDGLTVSTSENSSAATLSDRGGANVTGGTYFTTGVGFPAIYSTADIDASGAILRFFLVST